MANKTKVGFISLGCSKNLCDTEIMLKHLLDAGYEITPEETEADIVIVNTCAFIDTRTRYSRKCRRLTLFSVSAAYTR